MKTTYTILIASYLEPEHVERIRQVDTRLRVIYEPELLRPPRYAADHKGGPLERSPEQEARWRSYLAEADILYDFDQTHLEDLPDVAPNVRWLQSTSSGIGQFVHQMGYATRLPDTIFTTASGIHAQPLAEFCILTMLMFSRNLWEIQAQQAQRHWERLAGTDLAGRTLAIVGMGRVGRVAAQFAQSMGMTVIGSRRHPQPNDPAAQYVERLYPADELDAMLARAEYLVLCLPHTDETEKLIGARELAQLPRGAVVINIARGAVIDEPALIQALRSGHLAGAALDVFAEEPLPADNPLWTMPNVLVSPHSASTSDRENGRLTDLFCDNLRRFLDGRPLRNVLDVERLY